MDKYETDVLFEHTKHPRNGTILLGTPGKEAHDPWIRKRNPSKGVIRRRKVGILEPKELSASVEQLTADQKKREHEAA